MKSKSFYTGVFAMALILVTHQSVNAQRRSHNRTAQPPVQPVQSVKSTTSPTGFGGIPIIIDSTTMFDSTAKSIRPTSTFPEPGNRVALPYPYLRYDDAMYVQRVWRELDLREKINQPFRYDAIDNNGSQLFINILLKAVQSGQVQAFEDERFSIPLLSMKLTELTSGKIDTVPRYDPTTNTIDAFVVTRSAFDPSSVSKLRLMEEWIFDKQSSRMHCRIIGIAPLKTEYSAYRKDNKSTSVMFWVSYADLRPLLASVQVYNPKNMGSGRMTWDELFESRMFSSYIIKSSIDNAANKPIRATIKDPVLALIKGDNIKDKIFNYEQDLWSY